MLCWASEFENLGGRERKFALVGLNLGAELWSVLVFFTPEILKGVLLGRGLTTLWWRNARRSWGGRSTRCDDESRISRFAGAEPWGTRVENFEPSAGELIKKV